MLELTSPILALCQAAQEQWSPHPANRARHRISASQIDQQFPHDRSVCVDWSLVKCTNNASDSHRKTTCPDRDRGGVATTRTKSIRRVVIGIGCGQSSQNLLRQCSLKRAENIISLQSRDFRDIPHHSSHTLHLSLCLLIWLASHTYLVNLVNLLISRHAACDDSQMCRHVIGPSLLTQVSRLKFDVAKKNRATCKATVVVAKNNFRLKRRGINPKKKHQRLPRSETPFLFIKNTTEGMYFGAKSKRFGGDRPRGVLVGIPSNGLWKFLMKFV